MVERPGTKHGEEGVTLIEVLIVLAVVGILAAIVAFGVSTFRASSEGDACQAEASIGCP